MADVKANIYQLGFSGVSPASVASLVQKTLTTQQQTEVGALIRSIERYICEQTNRQFKTSDTYFETFDAGCEEYFLKNMPIASVTKITLDGTTIFDNSTTTIQEDVDFFVYPDHVFFESIQNSATNNRRALKIYYTIEKFWGEDVALAIKRSVSQLFLSSEYGTANVNSIGISGGLTLSFDPSTVEKYLKTIIANYRLRNI